MINNNFIILYKDISIKNNIMCQIICNIIYASVIFILVLSSFGVFFDGNRFSGFL